MHYACRICNSERREEIEKMLLRKVQYRAIAREFMGYFNCDLHLLEQSIGNHREKHLPKELTAEEKELLEKYKTGKISVEELARYTAAIAFENILRNPHCLKFSDFLKLERLKIKTSFKRDKPSYTYP